MVSETLITNMLKENNLLAKFYHQMTLLDIYVWYTVRKNNYYYRCIYATFNWLSVKTWNRRDFLLTNNYFWTLTWKGILGSVWPSKRTSHVCNKSMAPESQFTHGFIYRQQLAFASKSPILELVLKTAWLNW